MWRSRLLSLGRLAVGGTGFAIAVELSRGGFQTEDVKGRRYVSNWSRSLTLGINPSLAFCASAAPFDTKGFSNVLIPPASVGGANLQLVGVGMRRKNLYVAQVDVYLAALALSPISLANAKNSFTSESILKPQKGAKASVTLKFVRSVGASQVVEAFNDAFKDCDVNDVAKFKEALRNSIGEAGMKVNEEVTFYWVNDNELVVLKSGNPEQRLQSTQLSARLLDVYIDKSRAVSPDLLTSINSNLASM